MAMHTTLYCWQEDPERSVLHFNSYKNLCPYGKEEYYIVRMPRQHLYIVDV